MLFWLLPGIFLILQSLGDLSGFQHGYQVILIRQMGGYAYVAQVTKALKSSRNTLVSRIP
jgi:hypothetical protein